MIIFFEKDFFVLFKEVWKIWKLRAFRGERKEREERCRTRAD